MGQRVNSSFFSLTWRYPIPTQRQALINPLVEMYFVLEEYLSASGTSLGRKPFRFLQLAKILVLNTTHS